MAAYAMSKAALVHLTRILDLELRPLGIRVNSVAPQLLDTARNRVMFPKEVLAHAVAPESIAEVVAFLVSEGRPADSGAVLSRIWRLIKPTSDRPVRRLGRPAEPQRGAPLDQVRSHLRKATRARAPHRRQDRPSTPQGWDGRASAG